MTQDQSGALEKWAEFSEERAAIESFLEWLQCQPGFTWRSTMPMQDLLDRYYGVNRRDLEGGRRALLAEARP